jgi:hypothetical protein
LSLGLGGSSFPLWIPKLLDQNGCLQTELWPGFLWAETPCVLCYMQAHWCEEWRTQPKLLLRRRVTEFLLGSVVFYPFQHLIYHKRCFFLCFAISSLTLSLWQ